MAEDRPIHLNRRQSRMALRHRYSNEAFIDMENARQGSRSKHGKGASPYKYTQLPYDGESSQSSMSIQQQHHIPHSSRSSNSYTRYQHHHRRSVRLENPSAEYESIKDVFIDFCMRTSSHGIPFIG